MSKAPSWMRGLEILAGIVSIIVSFYVPTRPGVALLTISIFFAAALLLLGIARIARGIGAKGLSSWGRAVSVIVGLLALALALATVAFPLLGDLTVAFMFAFGLLFTGIGSIAGGQALGKAVSSWLRYLTIIIGVLGIIIACMILIFPLLGLARPHHAFCAGGWRDNLNQQSSGSGSMANVVRGSRRHPDWHAVRIQTKEKQLGLCVCRRWTLFSCF